MCRITNLNQPGEPSCERCGAIPEGCVAKYELKRQLSFEQTGLSPKLEIALEFERIALEDEYFVSRKLYPNVDFYSGLIYQAMGYPTDYFTVLFALGRLPGWIAQWEEMLNDAEQKISRPRQTYVGYDVRDFVPTKQRR